MSKIKDSELKAVIAALESDMNAAFEVSKAGLLAKADDEAAKKDGPPSESSDDSATPPASSASASPGPDASAPPAAPGPDAAATPAPDASAALAGAPGADPAAMDPAAAQAPLTPEALQAEYAQLAPEELDMHIKAALSAKEALAAASAPAPGAGAPPAASPAASPAPGAPPAASPAPEMAMKGEMKADVAPAGTPATHAKASGGQMNKSEAADAAALKAEVEGLKKSLAEQTAAFKNAQEDVEILTKSVKMVLERPMQKAITGISYLGKNEAQAPAVKKNFTPAEAKAKIAELIPTLTKSERELVLTASATGKFEPILPILEKYVK